jgi:hypothetical protein
MKCRDPKTNLMSDENLDNALNTIDLMMMIPVSPLAGALTVSVYDQKLYGGAHESINQWKHYGTLGFYTCSGLPEDNNPTSYDLLSFRTPYPTFYILRE